MIIRQNRLDRNRYYRFIQKGKRRMFTLIHIRILGFASWGAATGPIRKPVVATGIYVEQSPSAQRFLDKYLVGQSYVDSS